MELASTFADAWGAIERALNGGLGSIKGITYSEYRLLAAIAAGGDGGASRAQLAREVGLTPSAVTRALAPLAKLGMVTTDKHPRDARLAIAALTADGFELLDDATGVVHDTMSQIEDSTRLDASQRREALRLLREFARA